MSKLIEIKNNDNTWDCIFDEFEVKWSIKEDYYKTVYNIKINVTSKGKKSKQYSRSIRKDLWSWLNETGNIQNFIQIFSEAFYTAPYINSIPNFEKYDSINKIELIIENEYKVESHILVCFPFIQEVLKTSDINLYLNIYEILIKHKIKFGSFKNFYTTFLSSINTKNSDKENLDKLYIINFLLNTLVEDKNINFSEYWKDKEKYELDFNRINMTMSSKSARVSTLNYNPMWEQRKSFRELVNYVYNNLELDEIKILFFRNFKEIFNNYKLYDKKTWGDFKSFIYVMSNISDDQFHNGYRSYIFSIKEKLIDSNLFDILEKISIKSSKDSFYYIMAQFLVSQLGADKTFEILIQTIKLDNFTFSKLLWILENYEDPTEIPIAITAKLAD